MNELHVVLDIDNTLIDSVNKNEYENIKYDVRSPDLYYPQAQMLIWTRPHFQDFLKFLNEHVKYISIWTNGTKHWLDFIYNNLIAKHIDPRKIGFLFSIDYSTPIMIRNGNVSGKIYVKELKRILSNNASLRNTILIDDNYYNCYFNKNNSIPIKKYHIVHEKRKKYNELKNITEILISLKASQDVSETMGRVYQSIGDYEKLFN